jgi:CheY-like chemotaxis protein
VQTDKYILLVDDNFNDVQLFEEAAAGNCQAEIFATSSGEEAIDLLVREHFIPSLVVLEIDLPSGDGYRLLRFVREHPDLHTVPVVILTGTLALENIDPAWLMGANAVILKPASTEEMSVLVKSLCEVWLHFAVAPRPLVLAQL